MKTGEERFFEREKYRCLSAADAYHGVRARASGDIDAPGTACLPPEKTPPAVLCRDGGRVARGARTVASKELYDSSVDYIGYNDIWGRASPQEDPGDGLRQSSENEV
ncbi:hypothetical protein HPB50_018494 [Hyalomma asiaticum]|uniref:Uncharacterized protein n=1 Tax=Hyalomma asiaticum TaxID=266040 RepID=A0ACB7SZP6_HYAAI|nr:hypothetical protein HPB50_018494 [Hyalomma asiaticum]